MENRTNNKVEEFKQFVKRHPAMIKEVRSGNKTWQNFFEEWILLGENDDQWKKYRGNNTEKQKVKTDKKAAPSLDQIMSMIKNIDLNQLQQYVAQFGGAMATAQELLQMFQSNSAPNTKSTNRQSGQYPYDYPNPYFRD